MNIFESLENLQVSEECFNDIIRIVEKLITEADNENNNENSEGNDEPANLEAHKIRKEINDYFKSGALDNIKQTADGSAVMGTDHNLVNRLNYLKKRINEINKKNKPEDNK